MKDQGLWLTYFFLDFTVQKNPLKTIKQECF